MRKLFATLALLLPMLASAGGGFLSGMEDVPLPPGLTESAGGGVVFDSPQGRIVEADATGDMTGAEVLAFYAETLPQLGWTRLSDTQYRSETETLRISIAAGRKPLTVHFNLTPNNH